MNLLQAIERKTSSLGTKFCPLKHKYVRRRHRGKILRCCCHFLLQEVYFNTMQCPHSESLVYTYILLEKGKKLLVKFTPDAFSINLSFSSTLYIISDLEKTIYVLYPIREVDYLKGKGVWTNLKNEI